MIKTSREFDRLYKDLKDTIEFKVEDISFDIAAQIYDRLRELKITQTELSKVLGVSKSYISQVLNGNSNMTIKSFIKIAAAIDLKPIIKMEKKTEVKIFDFDENQSDMTPINLSITSTVGELENNFDIKGRNYGNTISEEYYHQSA